MRKFTLRADVGAWPRFGDYAVVEQKRHGAPNEMFYHKVVATLHSNSWVDVPVQSPPTATLHDTTEPVAIVICCGVSESNTYRVRVADMHKVEVSGRPGKAMSGWIRLMDKIPDQGQRVLVYSADLRVMSAQYFMHKPGIHDGDTGFCDENGDDIFPVTHWQPLPEPPTE